MGKRFCDLQRLASQTRRHSSVLLLKNKLFISTIHALSALQTVCLAVTCAPAVLPLARPKSEYMHRLMGGAYGHKRRYGIEVDRVNLGFACPSSELVELLGTWDAPDANDSALVGGGGK